MISDTILQIIQKGNEGFPLTDAYRLNHCYYTNFINMMSFFSENLQEKEYKELERKFLDASKCGEQVYLQALSELTVVYYSMRKFQSRFTYEPKYNGNFNPECSFVVENTTVNIEVKCPDMTRRMEIEQHDTYKINLAERIPNLKGEQLNSIFKHQPDDSQHSNIELLPRMDNKLKDFLLSAQDKFPEGDEYFNILVIALDILSDVDEWYNYIFDNNGVFTNNSFVTKYYGNVDAILLSTPVCGHRNWSGYDQVNIWDLEQTVNLLFLDPRKEHSQKGKFYFSQGIWLFGDLTYKFLEYQKNLDTTNSVSSDDKEFEDKYINFKVTELSIVSNFFNQLHDHT